MHRQFDKSNAGERLRTELTANEHVWGRKLVFEFPNPPFFNFKFKSDMKQITLSDSQWSHLYALLRDIRGRRYNDWYSCSVSEDSLLRVGMEPEHYKAALARYWDKYKIVDDLILFLQTNSREIEEGKA